MNREQFKGRKAGTACVQELRHKDGSSLKDYEYLLLVAENAERAEETARSRNSAFADYNGMPADVIALAKEVKRGYDAGNSPDELTNYVASCIELNK